MMKDGEKLATLKKAYAETILSTANEAASKIMATERKAMRFQQEIVAVKEEALYMLRRIEQFSEAKITEAENTSLNQQQKIKDLEAQLYEAEDIVIDLRAEIRQVQDKVQKLKRDKSLMKEPNIKGHSGTEETKFQENIHHTSDSIICPHVDSQPEFVIKYGVKDSSVSNLNQRNEGNESALELHFENQYACNFASIVTKNREPELSRDRCPQRIQDLERSLMDGNLSIFCEMSEMKEQDGLREVKQADKVKVKKHKSLSLMSIHLDNQVMEVSKGTSPLSNNNIQSGKKTCEINGNESLSYTAEDIKSDRVDVNKSKMECVKPCSTKKVTSTDNTFTDKVDYSRQENGSAETSANIVCKLNTEVVDAPMQLDLKTFDETANQIPLQLVNDRIIKYTFQRKRKKDSMSRTSDNASRETMNRNEEEGHGSWDSRHLV